MLRSPNCIVCMATLYAFMGYLWEMSGSYWVAVMLVTHCWHLTQVDLDVVVITTISSINVWTSTTGALTTVRKLHT
ncbi:uncharacterized protein HD556DRAFT_1376840 [Suillus plorans]|uniref:Uncharacterized protein n=1 Tax=Suillus plorans TaxID=116603 RepID=A0A9P7AND9_9AGAM|nr:uncharacterized protein HD556DRAFT_1376840 [Suillus plorans]KAG1792942.1 hypothetical protein HD556DRAFT_1376840 [Suillus plorans]